MERAKTTQNEPKPPKTSQNHPKRQDPQPAQNLAKTAKKNCQTTQVRQMAIHTVP